MCPCQVSVVDVPNVLGCPNFGAFCDDKVPIKWWCGLIVRLIVDHLTSRHDLILCC